MKKELKTWESLLTRRMKAMRVETPPLRTAGPMSTREEIIEKKLKKLDDFFYHGSVGSLHLGAGKGQECVADMH